MPVNKILPRFFTRAEIKRFVYYVNLKMPHCRPGQAICNQYNIEKELKDKLYEANFEETVQILHEDATS